MSDAELIEEMERLAQPGASFVYAEDDGPGPDVYRVLKALPRLTALARAGLGAEDMRGATDAAALARVIADANYEQRPNAGLPILASEALSLAESIIAAGYVRLKDPSND